MININNIPESIKYYIDREMYTFDFNHVKNRVMELNIDGVGIDLSAVKIDTLQVFQLATITKIFNYINIHYYIPVVIKDSTQARVKYTQTVSLKDINNISINIEENEDGYIIYIDRKEN